MSPALNGSSAVRCFEHSDAIEICNGIILDFYMGLPHICSAQSENLRFLETAIHLHDLQIVQHNITTKLPLGPFATAQTDLDQYQLS